MKIAVATANQGGLEDLVSPVFGRCFTFTFVEAEGETIDVEKVVENPSKDAPGGAGIQAAQLVINEGARVIIAGNFGPNATPMFAGEGVEMIPLQGISVRDAVRKYLNQEITALQGETPAGVTNVPPGTGAGRGMGMGRGMGSGMGRGGGRGMGRRAAGPAPFTDESRLVCPACGCTMPRKSGVVRCPNCGAEMR